MKNFLSKSVIAVIILILANTASAQEKQYKVACIAFYNQENLFDTINDPNINDEEFLPDGKNKWNAKRYEEKLNHMSEAISQIGDEYVKGGPVIVGLAEVENYNVVQDLVNTPKLKSSNYGIVHYDSPDKRGIDVALIFRKDYFKVIDSRNVKLNVAGKPDFATRDELVVHGTFDGEPLYVIVNHWPSRSGGQKRSAPMRNAAADLCKSIVDSIQKIDSTAKIVIMGDLNDDPTDASLTKHLLAKSEISQTGTKDLYNPMYNIFKKEGIGSLAYRDNWNLFDQIIVSGTLLGDNKSTYKFYKAKIFNRNFLTQKDGAYAGYPLRTYAGGVYQGGYSDHFPSYIFLIKEK
ncbi:MAG TPA: endonuclease/exonuclease/phosphatase family protein [Bacteroidales bacterium]|nr:endonuclease/exonuclease/phosphatase family protein [Bacteroidales bacterium]HPS16163.1 endonuclease/exonuclease/phosphatase family protein [Bacteroidales bacterium]